jgi:hypothetical protein
MQTVAEIHVFPDVGQLPGALSIRDLASLVDAHAASLWRGEEEGDCSFYKWLIACWTDCEEAEPESKPLAISRLAAGGNGIRWYDAVFDFIGYVEGDTRHRYVVSKSTMPSPLRPPLVH